MWTVIIADDEPFLLEGIRDMIPWEELGYELVAAKRNGQEVIDCIPRIRPDLVILDIKMPIMGGIEAARIISGKWPEIMIIFMTAYSEFQYAKSAIEYGVKSYVVKHNVLEELPVALKKMSLNLKKKYGQEEPEREQSQIEKITDYIDKNFSRKLTLDEISDYVHMNRSYLSRMYKKETGENLFDTINRKRVEAAKKYISEGGKKMWEIGSLVGVDDAAHFSKLFKKYAGCSPQEWRQIAEQEDNGR